MVWMERRKKDDERLNNFAYRVELPALESPVDAWGCFQNLLRNV